MEKLDGDLRDIKKQFGKFQDKNGENMFEFLKQMSETLHGIHSFGVIHKDIKTGNILVK